MDIVNYVHIWCTNMERKALICTMKMLVTQMFAKLIKRQNLEKVFLEYWK